MTEALSTTEEDLQPILDAPPLTDIVRAAQELRPAIIAIDGPAASGKSTVGFDLAETVGYLFFDTGVMYRAVTHAALENQVDVNDAETTGALAEALEIDILPSKPDANAGEDGRIEQNGPHSTVLVDGEDITSRLRTPDVDRNVSAVSAHRRVREALSEHQRRIGLRYGRGDAEKPGVVMVGRDIGTVVMPDARLKIYMDASAEERARRRYNEIRGTGKEADLDEVRRDIVRRDEQDSQRALSPLQAAPDAVIIDTSHLAPEQVLNRILTLVVEVANS